MGRVRNGALILPLLSLSLCVCGVCVCVCVRVFYLFIYHNFYFYPEVGDIVVVNGAQHYAVVGMFPLYFILLIFL